jgi:hypothetical protein
MESTGEVDPGVTQPRKQETEPASGATSPGEGFGPTQNRKEGATSPIGEMGPGPTKQSTVSAAAGMRCLGVGWLVGWLACPQQLQQGMSSGGSSGSTGEVGLNPTNSRAGVQVPTGEVGLTNTRQEKNDCGATSSIGEMELGSTQPKQRARSVGGASRSTSEVERRASATRSTRQSTVSASAGVKAPSSSDTHNNLAFKQVCWLTCLLVVWLVG